MASCRITTLSGPLVVARPLATATVGEVVHIGELNIVGEVLELQGDHEIIIQVFSNVHQLKEGDIVIGTGRCLQLELGPGLLNQHFNGLQECLQPHPDGFAPSYMKPELEGSPEANQALPLRPCNKPCMNLLRQG